jgi:hypothetical protein
MCRDFDLTAIAAIVGIVVWTTAIILLIIRWTRIEDDPA